MLEHVLLALICSPSVACLGFRVVDAASVDDSKDIVCLHTTAIHTTLCMPGDMDLVTAKDLVGLAFQHC